MNFVFAFIILAIAASINGQIPEEFESFKENNKKDYDYNKEVNDLRAGIFTREDWEIRRHNSKSNSTFKRGHSEFSDMTALEKATKLLGTKTPETIERDMLEMTVPIEFDERKLPKTLDLRKDRCLSEVKNQGGCGSCWAFTAMAPLEFAQCKKSKAKVVQLSEQQLVDCDAGNGGCNGGWYKSTWDYIQKGGAATSAAYAYTGKKAACKYESSMSKAKVSSSGYVATKNPAAMQAALVKYGPLSVAMTVINSFYSYKSGVYNDPACDNLGVNHGVAVVGYGALNGKDYWIVRNSWGKTWGDKGYILMQRGVNKCNIEIYPAFVVA